MPFFTAQSREIKTIAPGVHIRSWWDKNCTQLLVELDPKAELPDHEHPHEQCGIILSGSVQFTIGLETNQLGTGDMYSIPGNTPHKVKNGDQTTTLFEVFSPVREDFKY